MAKAAGSDSTLGKGTQERFAGTAKDMEGIVDRGYVLIGSPDEVAEQLREVATSLNVGHFMLLLQFGNMGKELTMYNTRLFAEKVLPQLRGHFSEWEDRWWPKPMAACRARGARRLCAQAGGGVAVPRSRCRAAPAGARPRR